MDNVDPLAEKYINISPYAYVTNNPVYFVDPDGREIRIFGGNEQVLTYTTGMEYDGNDNFISNIINNLNDLNSIEIGSPLIKTLSNSQNIFNIQFGDLGNESAGGIFQVNDSGGIDITFDNNNVSLKAVSHELFHGYQQEKVQGGASIFNEVEAYLYGSAVETNQTLAKGIPSNDSFGLSMNPSTSNGKLYEKSVGSLLWNNEFSSLDFDNAVKLFKTESPANSNGLYNKSYYLDRRNNQKKNLYNRENQKYTNLKSNVHFFVFLE